MGSIRSSGAVRLYGKFVHGARWFQSPFLLAVRLYWGWQFAQTGWGKLHHLKHVTMFFAGLGLPDPGLLAPFVAWVEFIGGILLILGLLGHLTGLVLAVDMFVAYLTADKAALHAVLRDPGTFYGADPFTFFLASLIIFVFGAGLFSLDALFSRRKTGSRSTAASQLAG